MGRDLARGRAASSESPRATSCVSRRGAATLSACPPDPRHPAGGHLRSLPLWLLGRRGRRRDAHRANELTLTAWDPVSQAAALQDSRRPSEQARTGARAGTRPDDYSISARGRTMTKVGLAIEWLQNAELELANDYRWIGERHALEHDIHHLTRTLASQCEQHAEQLRAFALRYGAQSNEQPDESSPFADTLARSRTKLSELAERQPTGIVLLGDLRHLFLKTQDVGILWIMLVQAAQALRDQDLLASAKASHQETVTQMHWLLTRIKEAAPQALTV